VQGGRDPRRRTPQRAKAARLSGFALSKRCPNGQLPLKAREASARLTGHKGVAEHGCAMNTVVYERERRSSRMFMRVRVKLAGKNQQGRRFRHASETIVINAHGALLYSDQDLEIGSLVVLTNSSTQEEQECRVVYLGDDAEKGQRVGIEFVSPSPQSN
jgi:hypothetical protein